MKNLLYFVLFILIVLPQSKLISQCAAPSSIYSFSVNGTDYEVVKENKLWIDAAECAVERGGYLVEINSQQEQDSIFYYLNNAGINNSMTIAPDGGGASYVWIGGNDIEFEGSWIWNGDNGDNAIQFWLGDQNGMPINDLYNNWGDEPDNWNDQDGLGLALTGWLHGDPGQWNDVKDLNELYFVIEYGSSGIQNGNIEHNSLLIHPNPVNNIAEFCLPGKLDGTSTITLYDAVGQTVQVIYNVILTSEDNLYEYDAGKLNSGIYLIVIETSDYTVTGKMIKN